MEMKARVNTQIPANLKRVYEDIFGQYEWSELLKDAAIQRLLTSGKVKGIKEVIRITEEEQEERRQLLIRTEKEIETLREKQQKIMDSALEDRREEWFKKKEKSLRTMYERHNLNYAWVAKEFDFSDANKAKAWFLERIKKA